jgi:hypothetical protein
MCPQQEICQLISSSSFFRQWEIGPHACPTFRQSRNPEHSAQLFCTLTHREQSHLRIVLGWQTNAIIDDYDRPLAYGT